MSEQSVVDLVERWQTGAALLLASTLAGAILAAALGNLFGGAAGLVGFVAGSVGCFLALSYYVYGR